MTNRRTMLKTVVALSAGRVAPGAPQPAVESDRTYWTGLLTKLAEPVLDNLAHGTLKRNMPVECASGQQAARRKYSHLEAVARLLAGIAPWIEAPLEAGAERKLQQRYAELARESLQFATDPRSPDLLNFSGGDQPLVDCGFLAQALLRAPAELCQKLDPATRRNLTAALVSSRVIVPGDSNWLLFSAMVETALAMMGEPWDAARIDRALRKHEEWYVGDGLYGDGPRFHWDYYNSFVIQPMLLDTLRNIHPYSSRWEGLLPGVLSRAQRYAAIQERLISPDGTFPPIGRSITYRCGAFHLLALLALGHQLPAPLTGPQVRCALTAAIRRLMEAPGTFDNAGWLRIGLCGHQPGLGESYISTGSLYLCSTVLLPLGLGPADPFWAGPAQEWTSRRIWSGEDMPADHAL
ncbi:MAG: DUF2264 domain-containing protein [Bryobacteraceae bacterium]